MKPVEKRILSEVCHSNAQAAHKAENYETATHWYNNCLELFPQNPDFHYSAAFPHALRRQYPQALHHFDVAAKAEKHRVNATYTRSLIKLNIGDYLGGFKDYEARLELDSIKPTLHPTIPYWHKEPCEQLLIFGEQGYGDIFMFGRYIPLVAEKFNIKHVVFEVPEPVLELIKYNMRNSPEITVVKHNSGAAADYSVHMASLPHYFETTIDTIPAPLKIEAEPEYIEKWKDVKGYVGICCGGRLDGGSPMIQEWNQRRNVNEQAVMDMLTIAHKQFTSLQNYTNQGIKTWSDTAGIIANCDMVISVDTGPYHLAATMGAKTILLNHKQTCWRHALEGNKSPWYGDNVTILRQTVDRDWGNVATELEAMLKDG